MLKKFLALAMVLSGMLTLSGCVLVNVNPERDNAEVIATVNGEDVRKEVFNNYMAQYTLGIETTDGAQMPVGSELKKAKEGLYDELIRQKVLLLEAEEQGIKPNESSSDPEAELEEVKADLGDKFDKIMTDNYITNEEYTEWYKSWSQDVLKTGALLDKIEDDFEKDPSKTLTEVVGKVGGEDVQRSEWSYYYLNHVMDYYGENGKFPETDEDGMEEINEEIFDDIAKVRALRKYCEDNGIELPEEDIKKEQDLLVSNFKANLGTDISDDTFKSFLTSYRLTPDAFASRARGEALVSVAEDKIQEHISDGLELSEDEIEKYYNDHSREYDDSTVSAMHILTKDEDAARQIYDEAKDITEEADFQDLIDKYKDVENITEAVDLGAFKYGDMVEPFSEAAFSAPVNTVTGPVQTDYGYHVIFVYAKDEQDSKPLTEVKDEITQTIKQEKSEEQAKDAEDKAIEAEDIEYEEVKLVDDAYIDTLKEKFGVKEYEKRIRA